MKISRQVASVSQILQLYVQDASVSTGAGLANVPATTVSYSWFRSNQNGASSAVATSSGTLGIFSSGAWLQVNSATALGWYQFGLPNDALLSGDASAVHLYVSTGAFPMAPLPVEIELTKFNNQAYVSSYAIASVSGTTNVNVIQAHGSAIVTSASGQFQVSTQAIDKGGYGVTSVAAAVTTKANVIQIQGVNAVTSVTGMLDVNVTRIVSSAAVTSAAGVLNVSTQAIDKGGYGVTSIAAAVTTTANIVQIYGQIAATSAAGVLTVSTQAIDKGGYGVTSISAAVTTTANVVQILGTASAGQAGYMGVDWAQVTSKAAYNDLSSTFISTNQAIAGASAPTALQVAQAVWDEIATSHTASSSFGFITQTMASNVSTLARSSDSRFIFLDVSVSSRAADGAAMALTAAERAALAGVVLGTTQAESYRASSAVGSIMQLMYETVAHLGEFSNVGLTKTLNSVTSHTGAVALYEYDSSTSPAAIARVG